MFKVPFFERGDSQISYSADATQPISVCYTLAIIIIGNNRSLSIVHTIFPHHRCVVSDTAEYNAVATNHHGSATSKATVTVKSESSSSSLSLSVFLSVCLFLLYNRMCVIFYCFSDLSCINNSNVYFSLGPGGGAVENSQLSDQCERREGGREVKGTVHHTSFSSYL